jgi:hypothetical protein
MKETHETARNSPPAEQGASPLAKYADRWLLPKAEIRSADSRERGKVWEYESVRI